MNIRTDQPLILNREKITQNIADFWDKISEGWRTIWGPHIHHGYYENNAPLSPLKAQEKLIEKLTEKLDISSQSKILDAGCGMGGTSIYLAKKYQAQLTGITLSQKQVMLATQQVQHNNLDKINFKIEDALTLNSFDNNSFDIVWSLESCEQFYDKKLFIEQAFRVLKPGGKLLLATWCSDRDEYRDALAKKYHKLCHAFDLPYMPSIAHYQQLITSQNFSLLSTDDWSSYVEKSWDIGISLVNTYSLIKLLKMGGWRGLRFAQQVKLMRDAFKQGTVRYGVFLATKPQ